MFVKFNLSIFLELMRQWEKSHKFFDLSAFNYNLNHSNLWSTLGVMNFQRWELFSGSPGRLSKNFYTDLKIWTLWRGRGHVTVNKPVISRIYIVAHTWPLCSAQISWMGWIHTKVNSKNPPTSLQSYKIECFVSFSTKYKSPSPK